MRLERAVRSAIEAGASSSAYMGTVVAIDTTAFALTVDIGTGVPLTGVRWIGSYTPAVDDFVVVLRVGHGWWVLGKNSINLNSPTPAPVISTVTVPSFAAFGGANPRGSPSWFWFASPLGVSQGLSPSQEIHAGVYGFAPLSQSVPSGATVLASKLRLTRDADDSGDAPRSPVVRLHSYTGVPPGQPTWIGSAWRPGAVAVGQSLVWDLPATWATQLLSGSARGVGLYSSAAADYSMWLPTAQITITYSEPA